MPTKRKASVKKKPAAKSSATPTSIQKTIYDKLKRKGMSDKQAAAFSKHAAKRKQGAASSKTATRKVSSRGKKK